MRERLKIAIVGAASLHGRELAEALEDSALAAAEFVLMDDEEGLGQIESVGDEVTVVQSIDADSFRHVDYVFFAGSPAQTSTHWHAAEAAHASIIDLSGVLETEPGVLVGAPWVKDAIENPNMAVPDLHTPALVPAHIAATTLGLLLARLQDVGAVRSAWATVCEPASEHGRAAVDELHQQTVTLLNFQNMPKDVFDMQVAFNLTPVLGEAAKIDLVATEARIRRHYALLSGGRLPAVGVQLLQVPAFHGYGISLGVELERGVALEHLEAALAGDHVDVVIGDGDPPSNLSSAGQEDVLLRVRQTNAEEALSTRFWIWAAFDNLKLASLNAIACAGELGRLRPRGKVQ
jgi:aspartate-semialdehyde dehydrogenase